MSFLGRETEKCMTTNIRNGEDIAAQSNTLSEYKTYLGYETAQRIAA